MDLLENEEELVKELCTRINAKKLKVLDVGCGTGKLSIYLSGKTGCDVTGIDRAPEKIEKARKNSDKVVFKVHSAEEMVFANSTFDVVIAWHTQSCKSIKRIKPRIERKREDIDY